MKRTYIPGTETAAWTFNGNHLTVTAIETASGAVALDGAVDFDDDIIRAIDLDGIDFINGEEFAEALADATGEGAVTEDAEPSSESVQSYMRAVRLQDAI